MLHIAAAYDFGVGNSWARTDIGPLRSGRQVCAREPSCTENSRRKAVFDVGDRSRRGAAVVRNLRYGMIADKGTALGPAGKQSVSHLAVVTVRHSGAAAWPGRQREGVSLTSLNPYRLLTSTDDAEIAWGSRVPRRFDLGNINPTQKSQGQTSTCRSLYPCRQECHICSKRIRHLVCTVHPQVAAACIQGASAPGYKLDHLCSPCRSCIPLLRRMHTRRSMTPPLLSAIEAS